MGRGGPLWPTLLNDYFIPPSPLTFREQPRAWRAPWLVAGDQDRALWGLFLHGPLPCRAHRDQLNEQIPHSLATAAQTLTYLACSWKRSCFA